MSGERQFGHVMSPANAAMPFPQYAAAVGIGLLILAAYFVLIAVTIARLRDWREHRERKPARRSRRSVLEGQHRP